jgi:hypothetical protein
VIQLFKVLLEDYVQSKSQRNQIPCNYPKHHLSGRRQLFIQTFLCVMKLRTVPSCIRSDISASSPDNTQCSTNYGISFQNTDMGRSLQSSRRCGFSSGRASYIYGNCVHQINRPNDHSLGPYARSLNMEIACN